MLVVPRLACPSWRWMTFALTTVARSPHVDSKHDGPRGGRTSRPSRRWRAPLELGGLLGTNGHKRIETRTRQLLLLTQGVAQRVGSHYFGHLLPTKQGAAPRCRNLRGRCASHRRAKLDRPACWRRVAPFPGGAQIAVGGGLVGPSVEEAGCSPPMKRARSWAMAEVAPLSAPRSGAEPLRRAPAGRAGIPARGGSRPPARS
jgi:hypothetical protein